MHRVYVYVHAYIGLYYYPYLANHNHAGKKLSRLSHKLSPCANHDFPFMQSQITYVSSASCCSEFSVARDIAIVCLYKA